MSRGHPSAKGGNSGRPGSLVDTPLVRGPPVTTDRAHGRQEVVVDGRLCPRCGDGVSDSSLRGVHRFVFGGAENLRPTSTTVRVQDRAGTGLSGKGRKGLGTSKRERCDEEWARRGGSGATLSRCRRFPRYPLAYPLVLSTSFSFFPLLFLSFSLFPLPPPRVLTDTFTLTYS